MKHNEKEWEVECMASKIKEVEMCKKDKPKVYKEALAKLGSEAKAIMSFDDIRELKEGDLAKAVEPDKEEEDGDDS